MALDLQQSFTWQNALKTSQKQYGKRTLKAFLHRPQYELYDLQTDADEVRNLAGPRLAADPKHQAVLTRMQEKLKRFQKETRDPWAE